MADKTLVTQGELRKTVTGLNALAANLNDHTNASLSKSHGWTGIRQTYQDSGGCVQSGPSDPAAVQRVVRIVVGNQIYYAPAQVSGGIDGQPDPVKPPYTGIISPQQSDPGSDLTVGSPAPAVLTTDFIPQLNYVADSAGAALVAHAGQPPDRVHGGLSAQIRSCRNSLGYVVGRRGLNLVIGGRTWSVVCDTARDGPTQSPHFGVGTPIFKWASNAPGVGSYGIRDIIDHEAGQLGGWYAEIVLYGTPPLTYKWEWSTNISGNIWNSVVVGQDIYTSSGLAKITPSYDAGGTLPGGIAIPAFSGVTYAAASVGTVLRLAAKDWWLGLGEDAGIGFRLTADNSALIDGGVASSGYCFVATGAY